MLNLRENFHRRMRCAFFTTILLGSFFLIITFSYFMIVQSRPLLFLTKLTNYEIIQQNFLGEHLFFGTLNQSISRSFLQNLFQFPEFDEEDLTEDLRIQVIPNTQTHKPTKPQTHTQQPMFGPLIKMEESKNNFTILMEKFNSEIISNLSKGIPCVGEKDSSADCASMTKVLHFNTLNSENFGCVLKKIKDYAKNLKEQGFVEPDPKSVSKSIWPPGVQIYNPSGVHCILHGYVSTYLKGGLGNTMYLSSSLLIEN